MNSDALTLKCLRVVHHLQLVKHNLYNFT